MTEASCLVCTKPTSDGRDFHEACWPEAKRHMDALVDMARRKFGFDFALIVKTDPFGNPHVTPMMRLHGIPPGRIGGIVVDEEPLQLHHVVEKEFIPAPCLCEKDADNRCPKCIGIISDFVKNNLSILKEIMEKQSKIQAPYDGCDACGKEYCDYTLAKVVGGIFREMLEIGGPEYRSVVLSLTKAMKAQFIAKGVDKWPLLDRAVRDLLESGDPPGEESLFL